MEDAHHATKAAVSIMPSMPMDHATQPLVHEPAHGAKHDRHRRGHDRRRQDRRLDDEVDDELDDQADDGDVVENSIGRSAPARRSCGSPSAAPYRRQSRRSAPSARDGPRSRPPGRTGSRPGGRQPSGRDAGLDLHLSGAGHRAEQEGREHDADRVGPAQQRHGDGVEADRRCRRRRHVADLAGICRRRRPASSPQIDIVRTMSSAGACRRAEAASGLAPVARISKPVVAAVQEPSGQRYGQRGEEAEVPIAPMMIGSSAATIASVLAKVTPVRCRATGR